MLKIDKDIELPSKVFMNGPYWSVVKDGKIISVHRLVMNAQKGQIVDHIDGDKENCLRSNLRFVTQKQNSWNRRGAKGYYWKKDKSKWCVQIKAHGKRVHGGYANTEEEANKLYRKKHAELFGEFSPYWEELYV